jgi:hypothetical protein
MNASPAIACLRVRTGRRIRGGDKPACGLRRGPAGGLAARAVKVRRVARRLVRGSARPPRARRRDFVTNRHE